MSTVSMSSIQAVRVKRVVDGRGGPPLEDGVVEFASERINRVVPAADYGAPEGVSVWDLRPYTLLPGLIDAHVHVLASGELSEPGWFVRGATELPATVALNAFANAHRALRAGFTTIRDLACRHYADVALRDAINAGLVEGPRMKVCGMGLTSSAGHMDPGSTLIPGVEPHGLAEVVDSPDQGRAAVRRNLRRRVDFIKINATESELVRGFGMQCSPEMTLETMRAICDVAHAHNRRVAAHCHGGIGVTWALEAGVDVLEHGRYLTDEHLETMVRRGVFLCPTLIPETVSPRPSDPAMVAWLDRTRAIMYESVRRARDAGVEIVNGSDAGFGGVTHGYGGACEIAELVNAGLSPMHAIVAATRTAARCLDMESQVGTIEPGKFADLVLVDGDPLADITILQRSERIPLVIKGGRIVADRRPSRTAAPAAHRTR
jgi:imidazolonepropionase-like amidohydrolase